MRNIPADIFADEFFGTLNKTNRLLWLGLILNIADDQGRMVDNTALMRSIIFPYDVDVTVKDVEKGLVLFSNKHKIHRYVSGMNGTGKQLIQIVNWWKYQRSSQWATRSQYPEPENWADRIRCHEKGNVIALLNWEKPGGFIEAVKPLRRNNAPATKPLSSREDEDEDRRRRKRGVNESIKGAAKKTKAPLLPSNFGRGTPRGHANLRKVKTNGNR